MLRTYLITLSIASISVLLAFVIFCVGTEVKILFGAKYSYHCNHKPKNYKWWWYYKYLNQYFWLYYGIKFRQNAI